MKTGEIYQSAIWLTGNETPEDRAKFEREITEGLTDECARQGYLHGPVTFHELKPGDDHVPAVPDHVHGPSVRLLVCEGRIVCRAPIIRQRAFVGDLDAVDLERLRKITRAAWATYAPGSTLQDWAVDDIIEELGPEVAAKRLRQAVDSGAVH